MSSKLLPQNRIPRTFDRTISRRAVLRGAGVVMALRAIRGGGRELTEDTPVPSKIFGPSSLISTSEEKEVQKQWDALPKSSAKSVGTGAH